jgi:hypothetical protein
MNGAMFNSLARFIDKNYPEVSFADLCRDASLKTNVFAELTWYPDKDFERLVKTLGDQTETELSTLWRELGRETFSYFADIFGDYMSEIKNFSDLITRMDRIHHNIKRDGLGTLPRLEFREASPGQFQIRYSSERNLNDFFLGMLEGAVRHYRSDAKILARKQRGKLVVTISVEEPELVAV